MSEGIDNLVIRTIYNQDFSENFSIGSHIIRKGNTIIQEMFGEFKDSTKTSHVLNSTS